MGKKNQFIRVFGALKKKIQRSFKILLGYLRISDSAIEHRANKKKKGENRDDRRRGGISSVQSLSHVRLFATAWTAARQVSLSITNSESLLKLMPLSQ